jgi:hypothetical protein
MISAAEFLKWCEVFHVEFGPNAVTIPVSLAQGGTGAALTASNGGVLYSGPSHLSILAGTATAHEVFVSGSNSAPSWSGLSALIDTVIGGTQGDIMYRNATSWVVLAPGTSGYFLQTLGAAANPQWAIAPGTGTVDAGDTHQLAFYPADGALVEGLVTPTTGVLTAVAGALVWDDFLPLSLGGTNANLTASPKSLVYGTADAMAFLATGNNGVLITDSSGNPSISSTLPAAVQGNITTLGVQAQALNMGGFQITNGALPSVSTDYATKGYVDSIASGGAAPVYAASTADLTGYTYNNGTAGVGATLTAPGNGVFTIDGVTPPVSSRILYKNDTTGSGVYNGIYTLTTSSGGSPAVLTRATDYDTPSEINATGLIPVLNGTANGGTGWYNSTIVVTIGTTAITYIQFGTISYPISLMNGGTNASLTASNGGIVYSNATQLAILNGTATAHQLLMSGSSTTPLWSTSTYPTTNAVNTLLYASSANVMAALATVNSASLSTNASGVPTWLALTDGQIVIGSSSGAPLAGSITGGTGITVTPGANSITISASAVPRAWSTVTAATLNAVVGSGYVLNHASTACVVTLPASAALGDTIVFKGLAASGGWTLTGNTGQTLQFGSVSSTSGGSFSSTDGSDSAMVTCIVANTVWEVSNVVSQGLTRA